MSSETPFQTVSSFDHLVTQWTSTVTVSLGSARNSSRVHATAEEAMTLGPSTIRPSARLEAMVERMRRQKLTNLPVTTSDGRLVGLLTLPDAEEALRRLGR